MTDALNRILDQRRGGRQVPLILGGVGALVVLVSLFRWGTAPDWTAVQDRLPLEVAGDVTRVLDEQGIRYRLAAAGTRVEVRESDLPRARIALAQEGLPSAGRPGFELFDQPAWGMTDFTQRVNYRRALEGELERTIGAMRGVEGAQVHITLPERALFRRDAPAPEASVVLRLRGGQRPDRGTVEGIAFLVASGVEGLESEAVRVLDDSGRLLSGSDAAGGGGLSSRQLSVRQEVEGYLEAKAEELLGRVMGPGNASVRVAADLNFDQVGRTTQAVDPEQQVLTREDRAEITPGLPEQGASSLTTNVQFETTRSIETVTRDGVRIDRLSVAVLVGDRQVEEGGAVRWEPRTQQELARFEALVRNAVGLSEERGDAISVVSLPMDPTVALAIPEAPAGPDLVAIAQATGRPLVAVTALVVLLVLALRLLKVSRVAASPSGAAALPAGTGSRAEEVEGRESTLAVASAGGPAALPDPQLTARLVRAWLTEG